MKVYFIKDSPQGGKKGDIKEVSDGYGANFLIAKGFAVPATPQIIAKIEKEGREAEDKRIKDLKKLEALKQNLEKRIFTVKVKVGDKGQIFGGIHEKEIAEKLSRESGISIEKSQISLSAPLKTLGEHKIKVKLAGNLEAGIKILVQG